jgi:lipocalin
MKMNDRYKQRVVSAYKKFLGQMRLNTVLQRFSLEQFAGTWKQVASSRTTQLFGSPDTLSSIQATYKPTKKIGEVSVLNEAFDVNLKKVSIKGTSQSLDPKYPTCRDVTFPKNRGGNYWVCHITPSGNSFIVTIPLFLKVPYTYIAFNLTSTLGCYVLSKSENYWNSPEEVNSVNKALKELGFVSFYNEVTPTAVTLEHS